jgi:hypothetical protein
VAYEKKVHKHVSKLWGWKYLPSPWIRYKLVSGALKWCQPDGLYIDPRAGLLVIVEVKHAHTSAAYQQLWELYAPVLRKIFPPDLWDYRFLEIVRWYDCQTYFPGKHRLRKCIEEVRPHETSVLIWNPNR